MFLALFGPWIAPHAPDETIAAPYGPPSGKALLGTDFLGRDVLSRALSGGRSVLLFALIATVAAYVGGLLIGLAAGHVRGWLDPVLMRSVDVLLAFPALVFILLVTTGLGKGVGAAALRHRADPAAADRADRPHGNARAVAAQLRRGCRRSG